MLFFRAADHIIYVKDPPPLLRDKIMSESVYDNLSNISRQLSLRKASFDVASLISEGEEGINFLLIVIQYNAIFIV